MAHAAQTFAWASLLPPRPLRWASRVFGIYLSAGVAAACLAGIAGVVPGSPLRTLLTAPASPPATLAAPAPRADAPQIEAPAPEPAESLQEIAGGPSHFPLNLAQASTSGLPGLADGPGLVLTPPTDAVQDRADAGRADWSVQLGAFRGRSEAVQAATSARRRIGAGKALVTEKLAPDNPGRKDAVYLAMVGGLTVPQARAACGAGPACLIFAPNEPVAPDLLPPDPIVPIVTGSTDNTGSPQANLTSSGRRANAVVNGLVARSIPVQKLQFLGKGVSDPAVVDASPPAPGAGR